MWERNFITDKTKPVLYSNFSAAIIQRFLKTLHPTSRYNNSLIRYIVLIYQIHMGKTITWKFWLIFYFGSDSTHYWSYYKWLKCNMIIHATVYVVVHTTEKIIWSNLKQKTITKMEQKTIPLSSFSTSPTSKPPFTPLSLSSVFCSASLSCIFHMHSLPNKWRNANVIKNVTEKIPCVITNAQFLFFHFYHNLSHLQVHGICLNIWY